MKTTLDLPDDLLIEAKAVAARRRTTLKAMIEHSLRREIGALSQSPTLKNFTDINAHGFPILKRRGGKPVTSEAVYALMDEEAERS